MPALAIPIAEIAAWVVAIAVLALLAYIAYGLHEIISRTVGHIPVIGSVANSVTRDIESVLSNTLAGAISGLDRSVARFWHYLSLALDWTVRIVETSAEVGLALASIADGIPNARARGWIQAAIHLALSGFRSIINAAEHRLSVVEHKIEHAGKGAIGAAVHDAVKPIQGELHTLERWTYPKVRALDSTVTGTLEPDVAALRDRVKQLEDGALRVYRDASGTLRLSSVERFAAALTLTLPSLGLEWLRCRGMRNFFRSTGCGLGNFMELLLGDAFLALAVTDLCEFANLAMVTARELEPALFALVDATDALVGCHGASKPAALGIPAVPTLLTGSGLKLAR